MLSKNNETLYATYRYQGLSKALQKNFIKLTIYEIKLAIFYILFSTPLQARGGKIFSGPSNTDNGNYLSPRIHKKKIDLFFRIYRNMGKWWSTRKKLKIKIYYYEFLKWILNILLLKTRPKVSIIM